MWQIADSIWNAGSVAHRAFSRPWSGTPEQWLMVATGLCFLFLLLLMLYVWRQDGGAVLVQRFRDLPQQIALAQAQRSRQTTSGRFIKLMAWILMGLILAVFLRRSFVMQ
jgi:hypothetical protein